MRKQLLTLAAAAAMACSSMAFAADETNRGARTANEIPNTPQGGQTGAAKTSDSTAGSNTGSSVSGSGSSSGSSSSSDRTTGGTSSMNQSAGTSGSSRTGTSSDMNSSSSTSGLGSARSTGTATGDMAQASANATSESDLTQTLSSANDPDKFFLVCAAIDNKAEMQLAQLAQQKSQDPQVKQIADRMIQDHQQAQRQLSEAAQQAGVQLPQSLPATKQQEMRVMQTLNGKDFDQQYISKMRAGHAKAVSEYTDVSQLAKNDQIKKYATQTLPTLQEHYQHVEKTATALGLPNLSEAQPAGARMRGNDGGGQK